MMVSDWKYILTRRQYMNNICIGIVDDDKGHVTDIQRVFARYSKLEDTSLSFSYESFYKDENSDYGALLESIMDAIKAQSIDCLIIDYKLVFTHETNKGADIINTVRDILPEFPCIILTGRGDECAKEFRVDPDKIYVKEDFLAIGEVVSTTLVKKIVSNVIITKKRKQELIAQIAVLKEQIKSDEDGTDVNELIEKIIVLESKLDKYCMVGQSEIDKLYDSSSLEKIVSLIERANDLLE